MTEKKKKEKYARAGMGEDRPEMQLEKDSKDRQAEIQTESQSLDDTSHLDYHKIQLWNGWIHFRSSSSGFHNMILAERV